MGEEHEQGPSVATHGKGLSHRGATANGRYACAVLGDDWYTIGLTAGLATALGVLLAALLATVRWGVPVAFLGGVAGGVLIGLLPWGWDEAIAGGVAGGLGALGASGIVRGALRRGGTRGATALIVGAASLLLAALALVPVVGYLVAVAVPALAARLRRRSDRTYAGLRILAKD
jgi:hypothetical protein